MNSRSPARRTNPLIAKKKIITSLQKENRQNPQSLFLNQRDNTTVLRKDTSFQHFKREITPMNEKQRHFLDYIWLIRKGNLQAGWLNTNVLEKNGCCVSTMDVYDLLINMHFNQWLKNENIIIIILNIYDIFY